MSRTRRLVPVGLLVITMGGAVWYIATREPAYQGRPLSGWLKDLDVDRSSLNRDQVKQAIRQVGAQDLDYLVRELAVTDGRLKRFLMSQPLVPLRLTSAGVRQRRALVALQLLGREAEPAVPGLIPLLHHGQTAAAASGALSSIGPPAIPALMDALTNQIPEVRFLAAEGLGIIGAQHRKEPLPNRLLLNCLKDTDPRVRQTAALWLGEIAREPDRVVPALIAALKDSDRHVRAHSVAALGKFGRAAKPAVGALLQATLDADRTVQSLATNALRQIAPAVLSAPPIR